MGNLIVLEGLDGSGKATQTEILHQALAAEGRRSRVVSFPDYKSHSSTLVRMYLDGDFGSEPDDVNAYAASTFYAVDRYASFVQKWAGYYNAGGLVLADRYTTSNAIHQCAKLPQELWEGFVEWLMDFEYQKLRIPRPDLVVCLDVEVGISQRLLSQRYAEDGTRDIHEQDVAYLERCREAAHWCAGRLGWQMVVCGERGVMRAREDIAAEIFEIVNREAL